MTYIPEGTRSVVGAWQKSQGGIDQNVPLSTINLRSAGRRRARFSNRRRCRNRTHHPQKPPMLGLRERAGLHDFDFVAHARNVVLVVHVADGSAANVLAVPRMLDQARYL